MLLRGLSSKQEFYKNIVIAFYKSFSKFCNLKLIDLTFRQLSLLSSDKDCWSSAKKENHEQWTIFYFGNLKFNETCAHRKSENGTLSLWFTKWSNPASSMPANSCSETCCSMSITSFERFSSKFLRNLQIYKLYF